MKSPSFRTIHVDGAVGGLTPNGHIQLAVYNERHPIPTKIVRNIDIEANSVEELRAEREVRSGIVHELEANLMLTPDVAMRVHMLLGEFIRLYTERESQQ